MVLLNFYPRTADSIGQSLPPDNLPLISKKSKKHIKPFKNKLKVKGLYSNSSIGPTKSFCSIFIRELRIVLVSLYHLTTCPSFPKNQKKHIKPFKNKLKVKGLYSNSSIGPTKSFCSIFILSLIHI